MDALPFTKSGCFPLGTERALLSRAAATLAVVRLSLSRALAADAISACAAALPWALPQNPVLAAMLPICHAHGSGGYASFVDATLKVPRLVVYRLDRNHTIGCSPRPPKFPCRT